jgi:hypothetical protein
MSALEKYETINIRKADAEQPEHLTEMAITILATFSGGIASCFGAIMPFFVLHYSLLIVITAIRVSNIVCHSMENLL